MNKPESSMFRGIRIVSDGTVMGTRVYSEDGEDLTGILRIRRIEWQHQAGGIPTATLECIVSKIVATVPECQLKEVDVTHLASTAVETEMALDRDE